MANQWRADLAAGAGQVVTETLAAAAVGILVAAVATDGIALDLVAAAAVDLLLFLVQLI
jgi:hypothetical protein